jgi:NADH:ubiquinone oxidoreductase subunit K
MVITHKSFALATISLLLLAVGVYGMFDRFYGVIGGALIPLFAILALAVSFMEDKKEKLRTPGQVIAFFVILCCAFGIAFLPWKEAHMRHMVQEHLMQFREAHNQ